MLVCGVCENSIKTMQRCTYRNRHPTKQPPMWATLEACWAHSAQAGHNVKQAQRTLATAATPDTTEEEQRAAQFHEPPAEVAAKPEYEGVQISEKDRTPVWAMISTHNPQVYEP